MRRFEHFTDKELYMLSRATIESSCCVYMGDGLSDTKYTSEQQKIHTDLMNELLLERKRRDYGTK